MTLVLDAGALVGVDRRDRTVLGLLRVAHRAGTPVATSAAVVAQVWRDGARQANLARVLDGVRIEALDDDRGRRLGVLLGRDRSADVVDAHVASLAASGDVVLTSDPDGLRRLLLSRGVTAEVRVV